MSLKFWGVQAAETALDFGCDRLAPAYEPWFRAVDVAAPAPVTFRWLCQMRVAPYSYDWIDNGGRCSPRTLTPGVDELATGQRWMEIFELVAFVAGEQLTLRMATRKGRMLFGDILVTYLVRDLGGARARLVAKLAVPPPRNALERAFRPLLGGGDLIMMRRQLLNLAGHAEQSAANVG
jgi:hypothetical protein